MSQRRSWNNDNTKVSCPEPYTVLNTLYVLSYLTLLTIPSGRYHYYLNFKDKETEAQRGT